MSIGRWTERSDGRIRALRVSLALALGVCVVLALSGMSLAAITPPLERAEAVAQSTDPVFESADYAIKDGTAPTIAGGAAYLFAGDDPWSPPGDSSIVAMDLGDGSLLWQKNLEWAGGMGSNARPLYDNGLLYIGCGKTVYCLDTANSGNILWNTDITPAPAPMGDTVIVSDPVMYTDASANKVVVVGDYTYGAYVGLSAADGSQLWRYDLDANSSASGSPGVDDAGNRLYLPQSAAFLSPTNGKIHCVDVAGAATKVWEFAAAYDVAGSVAFNQGDLYYSDFAYGGPISNFYCLEDKGGAAAERWSQPMWGSSGLPLVDANRGTVYACGNDYSVGGNHFYAFDTDGGDLVWDNPNWGAYDGEAALSPTTGYLYAGSYDTSSWPYAHNLGMAALDSDTGSELWYVSQKAGGDPVVSGGLVYSTADGRLYAYDEFVPSSYDWYFAEGYTGNNFEEWLTLANPGSGADDDAVVSVTYIFNGDRDPLTIDYPLPAGTRSTIDVKGTVGPDYEVSLEVVSDKPIVAERPIYFDYQGLENHDWTGGHCVVGADEPLKTWYFAEGTTLDGFEEWLTLANTNDELATVEVTYLYGNGDPLHVEYYIPGNRRVTYSVNEEAGDDRDVSIVVDSNRPIVAERPMYFDYMGLEANSWTGGHCVMGAVETSRSWYFAEGYTGEGFEEWLTLANPNADDANVAVTYLYQGEEAATENYAVAANTRRTLSVNLEAGSGKDVSMVVESNQPILAERPMYFSYSGVWDGGSCVTGSPLPSNYWCLAEGYTAPSFDEYICISNPGKEKATVTVTPLFGGEAGSDYEIEAGQRFTIDLESNTPVERAYSVTSDRGVVVERSLYFDYMGLGSHGWKGGHCTMGATLKDIY
ncbi:MAG: PQQ-binding-like beta-propeller repeat protein [Actinomycetota bacterium]|nr:PQQ-binding-like beta-propeller repeat protein [Actinomycetota bacterium]